MINNNLITPFGTDLPKIPLDRYPRPQLRRDIWQNLNGEWDFAIYKQGELFGGYKNKIIVPFSPESALSGVQQTVTPQDMAYYRRTFTFQRVRDVVLLHFGAVDYRCVVYLNGTLVGKHRGGYFPFSFTLSDVVQDGENVLEVKVVDPSDTGVQAYGKQKLKRGGIWYTAQSGIWQTVWIEQTISNLVKGIRFTPDIDKATITVELDYNEKKEGFMFYICTEIGELRFSSPGPKLVLDMSKMMRLWSPESPYLYHAKVVTVSGDSFSTYFAMRKISVEKVGKFSRILLNNQPYFQKGLLDQGYWSDGLYTAPSDEAMIYDIRTMKEMGFNMLRKHIKIEPLRWYYHCDRLGMLVWQDVVSGGVITDNGVRREYPCYEKITGRKKIKKIPSDGPEHYALLGRENMAGRRGYQRDLVDTVNLLYNQPCVVMWVTFNESWGQFDSAQAVDTVMSMDKTRLVDATSGWFDQGVGSVNSLHNYRKKPWYPKYGKNDKRPIVLSECGGLTYSPGREHVFDSEKVCGYRGFKDADSCTKALVALQGNIKKAIKKKGLCAYVYTQVSDVEEELNGLLSYDRKVVKVNGKDIKEANDNLIIE